MDTFSAKLTALGYNLPSWAVPPSEHLVAAYEKQFALHLPADYREFLGRHGGVIGSAVCPIREPCPCGPAAVVESFLGFMSPNQQPSSDIRWMTDLIDGAPAVVPIAQGVFAGMIWLKCSGRDAGCVYFYDGEQRPLWPDEEFHERFQALGPEIQEYLAMRQRQELPRKPKGYEDLYLLAGSFREFLDSCQPSGE